MDDTVGGRKNGLEGLEMHWLRAIEAIMSCCCLPPGATDIYYLWDQELVDIGHE